MTVSRNVRSPRTHQKAAIGLLAIGVSGPWDVAIDETTPGRDRWFAQVEGPSLSLYFEIPSLQVIDQVIQFLSAATSLMRPGSVENTESSSLVIGSSKSAQVTLLRDNEFPDRFFMLIESNGAAIVRLTVAAHDLMHLTNALRQVQSDLDVS